METPEQNDEEFNKTTITLVSEFIQKSGLDPKAVRLESFKEFFKVLNFSAHIPTVTEIAMEIKVKYFQSSESCMFCGAEIPGDEFVKLSNDHAAIVLAARIIVQKRKKLEAAQTFQSSRFKVCSSHFSEIFDLFFTGLEIGYSHNVLHSPISLMENWCELVHRIKNNQFDEEDDDESDEELAKNDEKKQDEEKESEDSKEEDSDEADDDEDEVELDGDDPEFDVVEFIPIMQEFQEMYYRPKQDDIFAPDSPIVAAPGPVEMIISMTEEELVDNEIWQVFEENFENDGMETYGEGKADGKEERKGYDSSSDTPKRPKIESLENESGNDYNGKSENSPQTSENDDARNDQHKIIRTFE